MSKIELNGLETPWGFKSPNKMANADTYYGPYDSLQDALDTIPTPLRIKGRTVGIIINNKVVEYWWVDDDISDKGLVKKLPTPNIISSDNSVNINQTRENNDLVIDIRSILTSHTERFIIEDENLPIKIKTNLEFIDFESIYFDGVLLDRFDYQVISLNEILITNIGHLYFQKEKYIVTIKGSIYIE